MTDQNNNKIVGEQNAGNQSVILDTLLLPVAVIGLIIIVLVMLCLEVYMNCTTPQSK